MTYLHEIKKMLFLPVFLFQFSSAALISCLGNRNCPSPGTPERCRFTRCGCLQQTAAQTRCLRKN